MLRFTQHLNPGMLDSEVTWGGIKQGSTSKDVGDTEHTCSCEQMFKVTRPEGLGGSNTVLYAKHAL